MGTTLDTARLCRNNTSLLGRISALEGNRKRKADSDWFSRGSWRGCLPMLRSIFYFLQEILIGFALFVDLHISVGLDSNHHRQRVRQLPRLVRYVREVHHR